MALPNGYTRVEYIQCSGGQYFDSDFTPNNKTRIEVEFMWHGGTNGYLYGAVDSNNAKSVTATLSANGGNWRFDGTYFSLKASANTIYSVVMDSSGVTVNGTLNKYTGTVSAFTALNTLTVCGGKNSNGSMSTSYFIGKVYYFRIYDNGTLVRNLIPCKNASSAVGMYDDVNGVFYANKGSGSFVAGPEIVDEYKIVNATELDGAITATADAIRAQTGGSAKIAWDASKGFASAIEAISGAKVATGTFNTGDNLYVCNDPFTLSGLGFKPSRVVFFVKATAVSHWGNGILCADSNGNIYTAYYTEEWYDEETEETLYSEYVGTFDGSDDGSFAITLNSDGFTVSATGYGEYDQIRLHDTGYAYIAIG